jgi:hypothetical protein
MALMAARGMITPMPDAAIFADTRDEPAAVYEHLRWLMSGVLPFPVYVTSERGRLSEAVFAGYKDARPPLFIKTKKGRGMLGRQCTRNFKLRPIRRKAREILGVGSRSYVAPGAISMWIGISVDEIIRARPSGIRFLANRHPLLELGKTRDGCLEWLAAEGYPRPPKSSCVYCPYKSDLQWATMKRDEPAEFAYAVAFDAGVRSRAMVELYGKAGYVHPSLVPLGEVDFGTGRDEKNEFINDCEGMCGV